MLKSFRYFSVDDHSYCIRVDHLELVFDNWELAFAFRFENLVNDVRGAVLGNFTPHGLSRGLLVNCILLEHLAKDSPGSLEGWVTTKQASVL